MADLSKHLVRVDSKPTECPRCHEHALIIQGFYGRSGLLVNIRLWCPLCDGLNEGSKP